MKKGFTLIELLAVIILLAVIALIATPIVLNVIDSAKLKAFEESAYGIIETVKLKNYEGMFEGTDTNKTYTFPNDELVFQGEKPKGGSVASQNGEVVLAIHNGKWCATKKLSEEKITITENIDSCDLKLVSLNGIIKNTNPIEAKVQLLKNNNVIYETTSNIDGEYQFDNIIADTYVVLISQAYKTKYGREIEIFNDATKDFNVVLYFGDITDDGAIDNDDYDKFINGGCYGESVIQHPECEIYNFNQDDFVDYYDIGLFSSNLGKFDDIVLNGNSNLGGTIFPYHGLEVKITIKNNVDNNELILGETETFNFNDLTNGKYNLKIEKAGYLTYNKYIVIDKNRLDFDITLLAGDVDDNGVIDDDDLELIREEFNNPINNDNNWLDLNNDGFINIADVQLARRNIGKNYN